MRYQATTTADPPFDFAQSRLFGDDNKKSEGERRWLCGEGEDGSPVEAGTEGGEDDGGCGWGGVGGVPLGGGDEEGGRGGVAVALDVAEETGFGIGDLQCGGYFADEVDVGLVHEEDADVCR